MEFRETYDAISYIYDYYPVRSEHHHGISEEILAFKQGNDAAIRRFASDMKEAMDEKYKGNYDELRDTVICIVPSHEAGKYSAGLFRLAAYLIYCYGMIDGTRIIKRKISHDKIASGGDRSVKSQLLTLEIDDSCHIAGKDIIVLDDVTTTGNSIEAVRRLLRAHNVRRVYAQTLAKTFNDTEYAPFHWDEYMDYSDEDLVEETKDDLTEDDAIIKLYFEYFDEKTGEPCDNCGNCHREYKEIDMTEEAKQVINCVYESKGKYGLDIILGTLLGDNRARLKELGTVDYKTYGKLKNRSEDELRMLVSRLVLDGYLIQTIEKNSVLKLGDITPLKDDSTHVVIRMNEEKEPKCQKKTSRKKSKKQRKADYCLKPGDAEQFVYKDFYYISEIRDELNRVSSVGNIKKVTGTVIWEFLSLSGYVEERMIDGKMTKVHTDAGKEKGIIRVEKTSTKGYIYTLLMYPPAVQKEIVESFIKE